MRRHGGGRPAPPPSATRWSRNGEFLVYLVPVGDISHERYASYVALLQQHHELPISSLTRPGGYAPELSPFKSFSWQSSGAIRFRFVSTATRIDSFDGEEVHAWNRPIGVIGICHSPSTPSLETAHAEFAAAIRHLRGTLVQKCFAFEHAFDERTVAQVASLSNLVMFPVHHELAAGCSTVSLHLRVVLDTIAVTILLSLESTIRAAMRQQMQSHNHHPFPLGSSTASQGDMASFLLDTNVELSQNHEPHLQLSTNLQLPVSTSTIKLSTDKPTDKPQRLHAAMASIASSAVSTTASALAAPFIDTSRSRKRQVARHRKLFGDYALLLNCVSDALEHYAVAIDLLKDEERKSSGAPSDVLWLAAAFEASAFALSLDCNDQFVVDIVDKASDALSLYARIRTYDLEIQLVEGIGWYCVAVALQLEHVAATTTGSGTDRMTEANWLKRVLWDVLDRGLSIIPDLRHQRQLAFVLEASRMLESVGHDRRMALFLHEAAAMLVTRTGTSSVLNRDTGSSQLSPPPAATPPMQSMLQRHKDLQAALLLEQLCAARLGIHDDLTASMSSDSVWRITTLQQSTKVRRGGTGTGTETTSTSSSVWLVLRLHVLRQLLTIAQQLHDPQLVARYCVQLLQMLPWCDSVATASTSVVQFALPMISTHGGAHSANQRRPASTRSRATPTSTAAAPIDQVQQPFTTQRVLSDRTGLFTKASAYFTPPSSIETKTKQRLFATLAAAAGAGATMSSAAAATLTSTLAHNTPRMLATPRQQLSAAVSAISTKASPAFATFSTSSHHGFGPANNSNSSASPSVGTTLSSITSDGTLSPAGSPSDGLNTGSSHHDRPVGSGSSHSQSTSTSAGSSRMAELSPSPLPMRPVWDIRSQSDVVRLERDVLRVLATECAALRPSEQRKLPTFLRVESLRVLPVRSHPFVPKAEALAKYGRDSTTSTSSGTNTSTRAKSDFFYSPFDKQQQQTTAAASTRDANDSNAPPNVFAVHEKLEIELVVTNPFGVAIDVQHANVWVEYDDVDSRTGPVASTATPTTAVECYPCAFALGAYERHKRVVLGVQPLVSGAFVVRGCVVKVLQLRTTHTLAVPTTLHVVGPLPLAALTLSEVGSLAPAGTVCRPLASADQRLCLFASERKRVALRVRNVSACAISRWRLALTLRRRDIARESVVVFSNVSNVAAATTAQERVTLASDRIAVRCTALRRSGSSPGGQDDAVVIASGDVVTLECELELLPSARRSYASEFEPLEEDDDVVWSFVYADDDADEDDEATAVYYRESALALTLVSLPSLTVTTAVLLPSTAECVVPTSDAGHTGLDNTHVLLVVEVANPTETAFRFRMHRRTATCDDGCDDDDDDDANGCDVEIGRKCSRRLALEVPRLHLLSPLAAAAATDSDTLAHRHQQPHDQRQQLADVLNALVAMEWATYFGTNGALRFEPQQLWRDGEDKYDTMRELLAPEFVFAITARVSRAADGTEGLVASSNSSLRLADSVAESVDNSVTNDNDDSIPMLAATRATAATTVSNVDSVKSTAVRSPFVFFEGAHVAAMRQQLNVRVLEFVTVTFDIRWRRVVNGNCGNGDAAVHAMIEISVTQDGHDNTCECDECDGDSECDNDCESVVDRNVVVVGMLQRDVELPPADVVSSSRTDESSHDVREYVVQHEIQLLLLSCGEFCVSVCGRVWDAASSTQRTIWSHQPLYICATE